MRRCQMTNTCLKKSIQNRFRLIFDILEDRLTPIVGQFTDPAFLYVPGSDSNQFTAAPLTVPNSGYDGVVSLKSNPVPAGDGQTSRELSTGSLVALRIGQGFGHHILTAAHAITVGVDSVGFDMFRFKTGGGNSVAEPVSFEIPVLRGPQYQVKEPNGYDIGVIRIVDPNADIDPVNPSRLLIAPAGAEQYELYGGTSELGQKVAVVGYGSTGDGSKGAYSPGGRKRNGVNKIDKVTRGGLSTQRLMSCSSTSTAASEFTTPWAIAEYQERSRFLRWTLAPPEGTPGGHFFSVNS